MFIVELKSLALLPDDDRMAALLPEDQLHLPFAVDSPGVAAGIVKESYVVRAPRAVRLSVVAFPPVSSRQPYWIYRDAMAR